jgi:Family of unknown function (DUF6127)
MEMIMDIWTDEMTGLVVSTAISLLVPYLVYVLERYLKIRLETPMAASPPTTRSSGAARLAERRDEHSMTLPRSGGYMHVPDAEFEATLTRAAEEGAKRALADVGLDGDEAALDIRDLRSLVDCIRLLRRTAMQTAGRMITTGVMLALLAGIAIERKIFGGP